MNDVPKYLDIHRGNYEENESKYFEIPPSKTPKRNENEGLFW